MVKNTITANKAAWGMLITAVLLYITGFTYLSIDRWAALFCSYDFAHIDSACYNTARGEFMKSNAMYYNYWQDHISAILLVISAFYVFSDSHWFIFFFQSFSVGLAAVPLFLLTRDILKNEWAALFIALAYLANGETHMGLLFDYHMYSHVALFFFSALFAAHKGKWGWFALFAALLLSLKEDSFIVLAGIGLFVAVALKEWKKAAAIWLVCGLYALVVFKVVFPIMNPPGAQRIETGFKLPSEDLSNDSFKHAGRYYWLGSSPTDIALKFVTEPMTMWEKLSEDKSRIHAWRGFLAQFGLLPLFSPLGLAILLFPSMELFLISYKMAYNLNGHYPMLIVPLYFFAAALGIQNIWTAAVRLGIDEKRRFAVTTALPLFLMLSNVYISQYHGVLQYVLTPGAGVEEPHRKHARKVGQALAKIPVGATVASHPDVFTHINHNPNVFMYYGYDKHPFTEKKIDYIVLDNKDPSGFNGREYQRKDAFNLIFHPDYGVFLESDYLFIFKRGHPKTLDYRFLTKGFWNFDAEKLRWETEGVRGVMTKDGKIGALQAVDGKTRPGTIAVSPAQELYDGAYEAYFTLEFPGGASEAARLSVLGDGKTLASKTLMGADSSGGQWREFRLPFSVRNGKSEKVRMTVVYVAGNLKVKNMRLDMSFETFEANLMKNP